MSDRATRVEGIDAARGLAVLAMFVAHGYDAWCSPSAKLGLAYGVTREIAASALPAFLLIAGVAIGMRWQRTPEAARPALRRALVMRGLRLIAAGYALNVAYALLDGGLGQGNVVLRADVLQAIGASMLVACSFALGAHSFPAHWLAFALVLVCPWLSRLSAHASGTLAYLLAPFLHVDAISAFAALPLAAFLLMGLVVVRAGASSAPPSSRSLALAGTALAIVGPLGTRDLLQAIPGPLAVTHVAVVPNALDGLGRALLVLAFGGLVPATLRGSLVLLGRHSLLLYAAHIPFCYGRLGAPLRGQLDFAQASLAFLLLASAPLAFLKLAQNHAAGTAVQTD
jgi:uncharacterized membrane protein